MVHCTFFILVVCSVLTWILSHSNHCSCICCINGTIFIILYQCSYFIINTVYYNLILFSKYALHVAFDLFSYDHGALQCFTTTYFLFISLLFYLTVPNLQTTVLCLTFNVSVNWPGDFLALGFLVDTYGLCQGLVITRLHDYQLLFVLLHGSFFLNRL